MLKRTTQRLARTLAPLTVLVGFGGFLTGTAHAQTVFLSVYSTGHSSVYNAGTQVQYANGASDTQWSVNGATSLVTTPNTAWVAANTTSKWISNVADSNGTVNLSAAGTHTFQTSFVMPSNAILSTATISFDFAADNSIASISTNGRLSGITGGGFGSFSSATLNSTNANFISGTNTLTFVVQNDGTTPNPMGVRVQFTEAKVQVSAAPEPASVALVALGGLPAIGIVARRRRNKS